MSLSSSEINRLSNLSKSDKERELNISAKHGNLDIVAYLIEHGVDIHADDDMALHAASEHGHLNVVTYLIEKGAKINAVDDYALLIASKNGHLEIVKYLVEHGANISAKNYYALNIALKNGHFEIMKYLYEVLQEKKEISATTAQILKRTPWEEICMYLQKDYKLAELSAMVVEIRLPLIKKDGSKKNKQELCADLAHDYEKFYMNRLKSFDISRKKIHKKRNIIRSFESECETHGYTFTKALGQGTYGTVKIACNKDKCEYVAKVSQLFVKSNPKIIDNDYLDMFVNEVSILEKLQNYGVVPQIHDYWICIDKTLGGLFGVIIMDKMDGDIEKLLEKLVKQKNIDGNYDNLRGIYGKISELLEVLKKLKILHLDLKPNNILFKKDEDWNIRLYLSDFGMTHDYTTGELPSYLEELNFPYIPPPEFVSGFDLLTFHKNVNGYIGSIDIDKIGIRDKVQNANEYFLDDKLV